jgi:hypothetical protein
MTAKAGIYTPLGLDDFELCHPINGQDFERINLEINGAPRQSSWEPIPMRLVHNDEGRRLLKSDSPWLGAHALIFRENAIHLMGSTLRAHGELLPLACSEADLWIYNPTFVIDALDEASSSIQRFHNGRIMWIQQHVFRARVLGDVEVFKIPNLRVSPTFFSHRFVDRWHASGLTGLEFIQEWASPNSLN